MNDKYYQDLIEKVISANQQYAEILYNEYDIRDPIGDGCQYFEALQNMFIDDKLDITYQTYFDVAYQCLMTFYGERYDPIPVWTDIAKRYKAVLETSDNVDSFNTAFLKFLNGGDVYLPTTDLFHELMRLAIEASSLEIATELLWITPKEIESWGQLEEIYENDPEWAAYIECLSDIEFDKLPKDQIFKDTIKKLHSKFGNMPNMDKLNNLYSRYF